MRIEQWARWLIPLAGLCTLAGYFGPWVDHRVAGLVITGLDLGEYVKFLPAVRAGSLSVWREGFYLPLVAVSFSQSFFAFRTTFQYPWPVRAGMLTVAIVAALNLLPPAWTPARLATPEFYAQSVALLLTLVAVALSPWLALLPGQLAGSLCFLLCGLAIWFPPRSFLAVLPGIAVLYNHPLQPGWGPYMMVFGLVVLGLSTGLAGWLERKKSP
ncbi:MAG TPA: hypothetical protein PKE45_22465 [Caldilineaceae bacterium]|nr:hypothetical protein [Caldilineaceae bacterium]